MKYQPTIGLEIHTELKTNSKMFCSCRNDPDEKQPNKNVCPVCLAHPGTLPVMNKSAIEKVLKTGLALNCKIATHSYFDRKNYFYPDLPKGYQISQYKDPLCGPGYLDINDKHIGITRIHLEEDTGRLAHPKGADYSLVDFNRAGVPLMELVTDPDIKTGLEARKFCEELQLILRYLEVSDADMEKGQMRCEVNISVSKDKKLGTKVEIKNLNSFRSVEKSIDYEIKRQTDVLDGGEKIVQETRGWDEGKQATVSQRIKEEAHDYRYFPEPDLPHFDIHHEENPDDLKKINEGGIYLADIRKTMPELPQQRKNRFLAEYFLPQDQVEILVKNKSLGEYFEKVASELKAWVLTEEQKHTIPLPEAKKLYKLAANYIITELQKLTKESPSKENLEKITPENFAELIKMTYLGQINSSAAQVVLKEMFINGGDPSNIIDQKKLRQVSDVSVIDEVIEKIIAQNPKVVADYKNGQENALQFFVGQIMKETKGQVNPQIAQEMLYKKLKH
ncbi:MAG: Asp-tRNA(Asn)/Glu-tRNA(Gln) amidotransferase subunit GatB [Candidatus Paceibacterota bacterium]|jgi:aspartyl-tRNA(Asn)/glutamyl-tRNA(Gln) amidotransferase subunit B